MESKADQLQFWFYETLQIFKIQSRIWNLYNLGLTDAVLKRPLFSPCLNFSYMGLTALQVFWNDTD